jgi:hypothetical protein
MQMHVDQLVALDNRVCYFKLPLNSMAFYPELDYTLYYVLTRKTKSLTYTFVLVIIEFCFSLSSFQSVSLL